MAELKSSEFIFEDDGSAVPLGRKIAMLRAMQHMTQRELAGLTGISQSNLSRIENGTYNPTVKSLGKIAAGLRTRLVIDFK